MEYSGAGGKLIHEKKTRSKRSRDTAPLKLGNNIFILLSEKRKSAIFVVFSIHIQIGRS
jgi:hypothetical protein